MPAALLILGLLSVGSVVFFARLAALSPRRDLISLERFQLVDVFVLLLLAFIYLFFSVLSMMQPPAIITRAGLVNGMFTNLIFLAFVLSVIGSRLINPLTLFGLWGRNPRTILSTAGMCFLGLLPLMCFSLVLMRLVFGEAPEQPLMIFLRTQSDLVDRSLLVFVAVILAPFGEEIIFRGYFYGVIRRYLGRWCGILISAVIFAAIHGHIPSLLPLFLLAVLLNLAYEFSGSLWTTMLMHGSFNSLSIILALKWPDLGA